MIILNAKQVARRFLLSNATTSFPFSTCYDDNIYFVMPHDSHLVVR